MRTFSTIIFFLFCFTLASQEREDLPILKDTTLSIGADELKDLEQKLESEDPTFRFKFISEKDVSFFLAAQKKRPQSFIWVDLVNMSFAGEKYNARQLENDNERKALFNNSLQYLTESLKTLKDLPLTGSSDSIKQVYNYCLGILRDDVAFAALGVGDFEKAKQMAEEMLTNNVDTASWNYNNIIHNADTILGRVAIKKNDIKKAKEYLIKSAEVSASPQLNSFGPSFILARELLKLGEKEIVIDYLDLVAKFWAKPGNRSSPDKIQKINKWKDEIYSGKMPDDREWR